MLKLDYFTIVGDYGKPEYFRIKFRGYKEYQTHDEELIIKVLDILKATQDNKDQNRLNQLKNLIPWVLE